MVLSSSSPDEESESLSLSESESDFCPPICSDVYAPANADDMEAKPFCLIFAGASSASSSSSSSSFAKSSKHFVKSASSLSMHSLNFAESAIFSLMQSSRSLPSPQRRSASSSDASNAPLTAAIPPAISTA